MTNTERIPFTCTLDCGSRCQLVAVVEDGVLRRIDTPSLLEDTTERPRLIPCVRGRAHRGLVGAGERVGFPRRRAGLRGSGRFERISWDEALDEVAARLLDLAGRSPLSLLHIIGAGSGGGRGFGGASASARFFSFWGPVTETTGNMSHHCADVAAQWMLGGPVPGSDRATLLQSRLILLWGNNPAETHMGPNTEHFLAAARDRGARVVLIDPRYSDSAVLADEWVPIRPGTDAALVAAMAYVMEAENLADRAFLGTHTVGYEHYRAYLLGHAVQESKTPQWAEAITGVPAATTVRLAREYATVRPACLLPGWGPQRTVYGEQAARAFITLACMSGNVGVIGGGVASVGVRGGPAPVGRLPQGPWAPGRRVNIVSWAADVLAGRLQPPCEMAYIVAANAVNRSPNTLANIAALERLGFVVVQGPYMTPTALCADVVLPIRTDLERSDLVTSWGYDSHLFGSRRVMDPLDEAQTDYWVMAQLAERLGFADVYTQGRDEETWIEVLLGQSRVDATTLRQQGIARWDPVPRTELAEFRRDPAGYPLGTASGRIELANPAALDFGLPLVAAYIPSSSPDPQCYPLQLLTPHSEVRANSCLDANPWLRQLEPQRVWIASSDACARGIGDGEVVEVVSAVGRSRLPAKVTERIMPGVVCIPQGAWFRPGADGVDEAGSANVLTAHDTSPTGGMATHGNWVQVQRCQR